MPSRLKSFIRGALPARDSRGSSEVEYGGKALKVEYVGVKALYDYIERHLDAHPEWLSVWRGRTAFHAYVQKQRQETTPPTDALPLVSPLMHYYMANGQLEQALALQSLVAMDLRDEGVFPFAAVVTSTGAPQLMNVVLCRDKPRGWLYHAWKSACANRMEHVYEASTLAFKQQRLPDIGEQSPVWDYRLAVDMARIAIANGDYRDAYQYASHIEKTLRNVLVSNAPLERKKQIASLWVLSLRVKADAITYLEYLDPLKTSLAVFQECQKAIKDLKVDKIIDTKTQDVLTAEVLHTYLRAAIRTWLVNPSLDQGSHFAIQRVFWKFIQVLDRIEAKRFIWLDTAARGYAVLEGNWSDAIRCLRESRGAKDVEEDISHRETLRALCLEDRMSRYRSRMTCCIIRLAAAESPPIEVDSHGTIVLKRQFDLESIRRSIDNTVKGVSPAYMRHTRMSVDFLMMKLYEIRSNQTP